MCVFLLVLFCICVAFYPFPLSLLHNRMKISLLGRQASTPFSHGLSQPIDQCKSKPVTSGHDILWLNFKCAYRSESLCTCRQKHWGRRLTRNARRFQLHLRICQGASSFALYEHAVAWMADIHTSVYSPQHLFLSVQQLILSQLPFSKYLSQDIGTIHSLIWMRCKHFVLVSLAWCVTAVQICTWQWNKLIYNCNFGVRLKDWVLKTTATTKDTEVMSSELTPGILSFFMTWEWTFLCSTPKNLIRIKTVFIFTLYLNG